MVQSSKNDPYQWKYLCIEGKKNEYSLKMI